MQELSRVTRDFFKPSTIPEKCRARRSRALWMVLLILMCLFQNGGGGGGR